MTDVSVQPEGGATSGVPSGASMAVRMLIPLAAGAAVSIAAASLSRPRSRTPFCARC